MNLVSVTLDPSDQEILPLTPAVCGGPQSGPESVVSRLGQGERLRPHAPTHGVSGLILGEGVLGWLWGGQSWVQEPHTAPYEGVMGVLRLQTGFRMAAQGARVVIGSCQ